MSSAGMVTGSWLPGEHRAGGSFEFLSAQGDVIRVRQDADGTLVIHTDGLDAGDQAVAVAPDHSARVVRADAMARSRTRFPTEN